MNNIETDNKKNFVEMYNEQARSGLDELKEDVAHLGDAQHEKSRILVVKLGILGLGDDNVNDYVNIINKSGEIQEYLDENLKKELGFDVIEGKIDHRKGFVLFCVKKLCPKKFKEIGQLIYDNLIALDGEYPVGVEGFMKGIKFYGDSAYEYLKFCSPFEGSYIKKGVSHLQGKYFGETLEDWEKRYEKENELNISFEQDVQETQNEEGAKSFFRQFYENFVEEPEASNLFSFLKENPQKLDNLGGKEIKSIDLSLNSGINFTFRGILEMVKSRPDIDFPNLKENASESEKIEWKHQWWKIIKEYETMLRNYIAEDKSKEKGKTFDKIFFTRDTDSSDDMFPWWPSKDWVQQFSGNEVLDASVDEEEIQIGGEDNLKLISDIEEYARNHPDEKILVCVEHHGGSDGSSYNGWTKEDWLRLANISPNIKIRSMRCYFGTAFDNKNIYTHKSSLSGFSNKTKGTASNSEIVQEAREKNLGFHEMEIYTRLNYASSVSPLTESMEYTDWNTGEQKVLKIGLADNGNQKADDSGVNYA